MKKVSVLGGGISGLSAAWRLGLYEGYAVDLYEKNDTLGGLCGFYDFNGMRLDYGPHKIYSIIPGVMAAMREIGGGVVKEVRKSHKIILRETLLDYPVKLHQLISLFSFFEIMTLCGSVAKAVVASFVSKRVTSYEEYCTAVFGRKIYEIVFMPLAEKIWGDPGSLSADIARKRIPIQSIRDLLLRVIGIRKESGSSNAEIILYPYEGFYRICDCMASKLEERGHRIHLGVRPSRFIIKDNAIVSIVFSSGAEAPCDLVISSIPLLELVALLFPEEGRALSKQQFAQMRHCILVYLLVERAAVLKDHWIFCADRSLLFSRISEQKLLSDYGFPPSKTVLCCDFTCDTEDPVWNEADRTIVGRCIEDLERMRFIRANEVIESRVVRIPSFYPRHAVGYEEKRAFLFDKIKCIRNVICTGRLGMADYYNVDHCVDMSMVIARALQSGVDPPTINDLLIERTRSYRIVD
jgi:protoporphyrinogen oxidase